MAKHTTNNLPNTPRVCIRSNRRTTPRQLLAETLESAGFHEQLESQRLRSKVEPDAFKILIKPDMELYEHRASTGTDPSLVEDLIDLLYDLGYTKITVADAANASGLWLENRGVLELADLSGYHFVTPDGHTYDFIDLSENPVDAGFPEGSILRGTSLSADWQAAHFRINFCKNKTDQENGFALALQNLTGILPLQAKDFHYRFRLRKEEVALDLLRHTEVHFTIIDAWQSNHGSQGTRSQNPQQTDTFIASNNLLLADWVGALKMGLDPFCSDLNAKALREVGLPAKYQINGDLSVYEGWKNVPIHLQESTRKRNTSPLALRLADACLQTVDTDMYPFKNMLDSQLNALFAQRFKGLESDPAAYWGLVTFNLALANLENYRQAWQILFDKDRLHRMDTRLNIDLALLKDSDFESIEDYILPFRTILEHTPPDRYGLRRRYLDGSVIFEYYKIIPVAYAEFIKKVDIAQAVQMMYDNIGGARAVVKKNRQGRVVYQAERDIYLPQPNWMVLFGGKHIDVDKLEVIRYDRNQQQNFWRTVHSSNQSAEYDDGMVCFAKDPGGVRVTILARQKFSLPLFWQVVNMDYLPDIKEALVSDAYFRFFSRTMANFEAAAEGRNPFVGQKWDTGYGEADKGSLPPEIEQLKGLFTFVAGFFEKWVKRPDAMNKQTEEVGIDEHGFRHYRAKSQEDAATDAMQRFVSELMGAIRKDIRLLGK